MRWISVLWKIWFLIYMFVSTLLFFPFLYFSIIVFKNYAVTFKIYRIWGSSICLFLGIYPKINGLNNIPNNQACILVANHTSQLDIIVPYALIPHHFTFMAKKELEKLPFFGINFKGMNITVDRKNPLSGQQALEKCKLKLQQGIHLLIFPEGTKNKQAPALSNFKQGAFKLATELNYPIVPLVFKHNYKRFGADFFKQSASPGISELLILPPIYPKDFSSAQNPIKAFKQYVFDQMNNAIDQA